MKQQLNVPSPIISIIVPIYNREKWLRNCLESISSQTFKDWECILVNDGSTDHSLKIAQEYAANDPRFIVFSQENQGVSAARNLGLDHAQGKWVTFVDSDDEIAPDYLEILHNLGEENNADIVYGSIMVYEKGNNRWSAILEDKVYDYQDEDFENNFKWRITGIIKLFRHSIIKKHNVRFDSRFRFGEDLIFTLEYYLHSQRFASSSKAIYKYISREESVTPLHDRLGDFESEIELYNKIVSFYELLRKRHPLTNKQLFYKVLCLDSFTQRLLKIIESRTNSLTKRYKMYRSIKLPLQYVVKGSRTQTFRNYLLYKRQYILFALSRIWVNLH